METKTEKDMALERFASLLASLLEKYAEKIDFKNLPSAKETCNV